MKALVLYDADTAPPVAVWWQAPDGTLGTYEAEISPAIVVASAVMDEKVEDFTWEDYFEFLSKGYPNSWGRFVLYETGEEKPVTYFRAMRKKIAAESR